MAPYELPEPMIPSCFESLVPVHVQQAIDSFRSEMSDKLNEITDTCHNSSDLVENAMQELNLPAALDALEATDGLTDEMWEKIANVQSKGGSQKLQKIQGNVVSGCEESVALYTEIRELLIVSRVVAIVILYLNLIATVNRKERAEERSRHAHEVRQAMGPFLL